ncbi:MAG: aquaporin, partial [Methanobacteriota archaeon]
QISPRLAVVYWVAQLLGGVGGALTLAAVFPVDIWQPYHLGTPTLGTVASLGWDVGTGTGILVEAVLTFFLVFVVFGTGIDPRGSFHAVGGMAIGLTIAIDIMMGGPLTGAAMNPARWFGPAVVSGFFVNGYVYWIGPFLGGAVAGLLYAYVFLEKPR